MASTSETGHAKNVTNLESLISSITAFGASYNPSKESIKLPALQALLTASKLSLEAVNATQSSYSVAVDAREIAFGPFNKLITRVNSALKASDSPVEVDESAQTIVRKLLGRRAGAKLTEEEKKALEAEGKEVNQISVSQMGYDTRLENFGKLISLLSTVPQYNPNEEDLKIDALKLLYNQLKSKNTDVVTAWFQLDNARNNRNGIIYQSLTGLVDLAADTKMYIKSVFGATSPEYKQVSKLSFTNHY